MAILTKRETWRRPKVLASGRTPDMTEEERASVKRALVFLRRRHGGAAKLAATMGTTQEVLERASRTKGKPSLGLALRAARLAGVGVEAILAGEWPEPGACPFCGRTG